MPLPAVPPPPLPMPPRSNDFQPRREPSEEASLELACVDDHGPVDFGLLCLALGSTGSSTDSLMPMATRWLQVEPAAAQPGCTGPCCPGVGGVWGPDTLLCLALKGSRPRCVYLSNYTTKRHPEQSCRARAGALGWFDDEPSCRASSGRWQARWENAFCTTGRGAGTVYIPFFGSRHCVT